MMSQAEINDKFKTLVHFIVSECSKNPAQLGAVRLNKTLWFSDMLAYKQRGLPISGATYIKKPQGPVASSMTACIEALVAERSIEVTEPSFPYEPRQFRALVKPDTSRLDEYETGLTRFVLSTLLGRTATDVSEMSHDRIWDMAEEGEEIPFFATLGAVKGEVTPEVVAWAKQQ